MAVPAVPGRARGAALSPSAALSAALLAALLPALAGCGQKGPLTLPPAERAAAPAGAASGAAR